MKKMFPLIVFIFVLSLNISGCAKRFSMTTVDEPRVDQDIKGNQGFISGAIPPEDQSKPRSTTRKIYQVTMEVPPYPEWKNFREEKTSDKDIWGNRGYVYGGPAAMKQETKESEAAAGQEKIVLPDENSYTAKEDIEQLPAAMPKTEPLNKQESFSLYKVKAGDTLQKVSKNVYGTSANWKKIYDYNHDSLKNPNKIYPGQTLKIPE